MDKVTDKPSPYRSTNLQDFNRYECLSVISLRTARYLSSNLMIENL